MITLFKQDETDFTHNGLGTLDKNIIEPVVSEQLNSVYQFTFRYPLFAPHGLEIEGQSIIRTPTPDDDDQLFRVYKPVKTMGYIEVSCYHIFYDLIDNFVADTNIVGKNGQGALNQILGATQYAHKFRGFSDIDTQNNARVVRRNVVESLLDDGKENSLISRWGGEFKRNNFDIRWNKAIGTDRGKKIRHKKDLIGYEADVDWTEITTRILPKGFDGLLLPERYVDSPIINKYVAPKIKMIEYDDVKAAVGEYKNDEDAIPLEEAYTLLRKLAKEEYSKRHIDTPKANYKVDFVTLEQTEEYKEFNELQKVLIGDTVTVVHEEDGLNIKAEVIDYEYNPIAKRYIKIELGNFNDALSKSYSDIQNIADRVNEIKQQTNIIQSTADGKNTIFRGINEPADPNINDLWYKPNGSETELYQYVEEAGQKFWKIIANTADLTSVKAEVTEALDKADEAKQEAIDSYEKSITDSKAYTEQKANEFNNQMEIVRADVADTVIKANTAVAKANQSIADVGFMQIDLNTTKQNAIDALTKAQTVTENFNTLSTSFDELTQTVGFKAEQATVDIVTKQVNQHELSIAANAKEIDLRMTSTQVDSLVSAKGYVNQTTLDATANGLSASITKVSSDLEGLEIGGRNLLRHSGEGFYSGGVGFYTHVKTVMDGIESLSFTNSSILYLNSNDLPTLETGETFTFSFYAKASVPLNLKSVYMSDNNNSYIPNTKITTAWERFSFTFTSKGNKVMRIHMYPTIGQGEYFYLANWKLEKGNKATDWTPAPEDMATLEQFTTIDATVKGLQTTVGNKADKTQVTQLANQWTQTTALVNGHTGQISNLGEQLNFRVTSSHVTEAILADKTVKDTRNDNQPPSWYFSNYPRQTVEEFKFGRVIGALPQIDASYGVLTTKVPWTDTSGGDITQTFSTSSGVYQRKGSTAWGTWDKIAEAGKLISQINISPESILIASNKITLSGDTYMDAAFINKMKVHSLDAVYADVATLKTKVLTADVITSTMLKSDTALIDKIFINDANVQRFTAKTAFINSVKAIDIAADRITAGTLNAAKVTIINLDASRITTGTITGITIKSPFDYIYEGAIRNNGTTTLSNGNLTMNGTFTNAYGSTFLSINPDTIYAENMQANGTVRSMFKLSGKGLELNQLGSSASYTQDGVYFESGGGAFIKYHRGNARIETGSYNGVGLGAIPNGVYQNRLTVGGGSDGLGPFVDIWAPLTVREGMNVMGKEIRNASFITGADVILFNNTTNRIVQGTNGIMNILSPIQIDLGYTDGTYGSPSLSITNNAVTMRKSLQMSGNRIDGASTINGAYSINGANNILFHNTTNRIVQGSDGFLNILSPMQLSLGWTDGVSSFTTMIITKNQVVAKRNLNMDGNQMVGVSDSRLKTAIDNTVMDSLSAISRWKFVDFNWRYDDKPKGRQFGLIAQDTPELALYDAQNDEYTISASKQIMMTSHGLSQLNVKVKSLSALTDASNATANQALSETQKLRQEIQVLRQKIEKLESAA